MNNGRRRSSGEGGATERRSKGEDGVTADKMILVKDTGIRIECDICLDNCHHATSTQCCQAQVRMIFFITNHGCFS